MIKSVDPSDTRAVRNLENVIAWNDTMISQKRPKEAIEKYTRPDYIQHNRLLEDGPQGIINYFTQVTTERRNARLVYYRAMNMDIHSLRMHKELMVWIFDQAITRRVEETFEQDLFHCREVTLEDVRSVGLWPRFRNSFARLFSAEI